MNCLCKKIQKQMIKYRHNFHLRKKQFYSYHHGSVNFPVGFENEAPMFVSSTQLCRFYFLYLLSKTIEQSSYDNQEAILISVL